MARIAKPQNLTIGDKIMLPNAKGIEEITVTAYNKRYLGIQLTLKKAYKKGEPLVINNPIEMENILENKQKELVAKEAELKAKEAAIEAKLKEQEQKKSAKK